MKEKKITKFIVPILLIVTFVAFTFLVTKIDVQPVGPENSKIGFATFNMAVHRLVGTHLVWYNITDCLGLVPVYFAFALGVLGFVQLVNRRSIFRIDKKLLLMGGFYILIIGLYVCFEKWIINYRPVVLGKNLEASYPSSHTMIVISILGTGIIFLKDYIKSKRVYNCISIIFMLVILVTVVGRCLSGVHWATDIIGGLLISSGIVCLYKVICDIL